MFPDIFGKKDYLINAIPILYWIYLLSINYKTLWLIITILYAISIIFNALYREDLLYKCRKGFLTSDFAKMIKKNLFFTVSALFYILLGFCTLIIMIFSEKNYFVWSLIFFYSIGLGYMLLSFWLKDRYHNKINDISKGIRK